MTTTNHPHIGSDFDTFLEEDGNLEAATATAIKRVIAWQIGQEMKAQHITKTAMAARMKTSRAALNRLLGFVVVFVAEHFVRPVLIGSSARLPFLLVLFGILGGAETFGLIGLFVGPALMTVLTMLWAEWIA